MRSVGQTGAWLDQSSVNLKLAFDLRNRIIQGYDSVDDEIVYLIATEDLEGLKVDLARLLAARG